MFNFRPASHSEILAADEVLRASISASSIPRKWILLWKMKINGLHNDSPLLKAIWIKRSGSVSECVCVRVCVFEESIKGWKHTEKYYELLWINVNFLSTVTSQNSKKNHNMRQLYFFSKYAGQIQTHKHIHAYIIKEINMNISVSMSTATLFTILFVSKPGFHQQMQ